jgi:xylan 1,4-beta-xylosidase
VFLEKKASAAVETVARALLPRASELKLKVTGDERLYSFYYDADGKGWKTLKENADGSILSTEVAGGFVGAVVGMHARKEE